MPDLVRAYSSFEAFAQVALPHLLRDEPLNNLQLGIIRRMMNDATLQPAFLATLHSLQGEVIGVATLNPGHGLILSGGSPEAVREVSQVMTVRSISLPGVFGPPESAKTFVDSWCVQNPVAPVRVGRRGVYALRKLQAPRPIDGRFATAEPEDLQLVLDWMHEFHAEIPDLGPPPTRELLESRIGARNVFLWLAPTADPASMAIVGRDSPNGASINFVYTPPRLRASGFASNCVAKVCETILARGKTFCTLFADLENVTSTALYERLGFERVGIADHYAFRASDGPG